DALAVLLCVGAVGGGEARGQAGATADRVVVGLDRAVAEDDHLRHLRQLDHGAVVLALATDALGENVAVLTLVRLAGAAVVDRAGEIDGCLVAVLLALPHGEAVDAAFLAGGHALGVARSLDGGAEGDVPRVGGPLGRVPVLGGVVAARGVVPGERTHVALG